MFVEMRTYRLQPGSVPEVEDLFLKAYPDRAPVSPLGGFWHTLTGQLNTIVHLWPYATLDERTQARADALKLTRWPPALRPFLVEMDAKVFLPTPFSPRLEPARHGSVYEFCLDSFLPGGTQEYGVQFQAALEARNALSPLVFCGTSEFGPLNELLHIWAYRDITHWGEVQAQTAKDKSWPPASGRQRMQRQQSFLVAPAAVSPLA